MKFPKGVSGNPGGKKPLSPEIKSMRDAALGRAIAILHAKIHDAKYIAKLRPLELIALLTTAFDRLGLPRVTQSELSGPGGSGEPMMVNVISYGAQFKD